MRRLIGLVREMRARGAMFRRGGHDGKMLIFTIMRPLRHPTRGIVVPCFAFPTITVADVCDSRVALPDIADRLFAIADLGFQRKAGA